VKKVRESRLAMPNADFDMFIAESMTLVVSRDLGRGLRRDLGGGGFEGEFVA
jgi:hypothetical protein